MGACCENSRKTGSNGYSSASQESTISSIRAKGLVKRSAELQRSFQITEDSFKLLQKDSISLIYRREKESSECKYLYSTIYQATHISSNTLVLVREVKKTIVRKKLTVEAFFESIALQKDLDHPNIAKIFELFQDEDYYYLIYEGLRGEFLSNYICENRSLPEVETAQIGGKVASIIGFLHSKNIVNRLICPGNLIFGLKGRSETIKLLDFSFAVRLGCEGTRFASALPNKYRAPEVSEEESYTKSSEIFSFGALLHSMLNGEDQGSLSEGQLDSLGEGISCRFRFKNSKSVAPQMMILVQSCAAIDPEKRPKVADLFRYSALKKSFLDSRGSHQRMGEQFTVPQYKGKIYQQILRFIINRVLKLSEKMPHIQFFESIDTNKDGSISKLEFLAKYFKLRNDPIAAQKEVDQLFRSINSDPTHQLTFSEFLSITMSRQFILSRQNVNAAFKLLDLNENGYITKESLSTHMGGSGISEGDWNELFRKTNSNHCHKISIQKFVDLLCKNTCNY